MNFVLFTRPDGQSALINLDDVEAITPAGRMNLGAKTVIHLVSGNSQAVREPFEYVAKKLGIEVK